MSSVPRLPAMFLTVGRMIDYFCILVGVAAIIGGSIVAANETTATRSNMDSKELRPNIIIFLADNLGYADISWLQQHHHHIGPSSSQGAVDDDPKSTDTTATTSRTRNIDTIGQNGMTFYNWNSAAHLCSASRASLLTGNYPARLGVYPGTFQPDARDGLLVPNNTDNDGDSNAHAGPFSYDQHRSSVTLASLLKKYTGPSGRSTAPKLRRSQKQYATAMVGKWHLGHTSTHLPTNHGFDTYVGIPYHMSGGSLDNHICTYDDVENGDKTKPKQWLPLYKNTTIVQQPVNVNTLAQTYVKEATTFIKQQLLTDTPYFLYMAFSHVHQLCASYTQVEQTTCQWSGILNNSSSNIHPSFTDAVQEMDWMVGQILDTIRHDQTNTIILFTSDNGPWLAEQSCSGLRGPYRAQWLRDNVAQNCTACPHDYVSNPTIENPRRCTLSRRKRRSRRQNQSATRISDESRDEYDDEIVVQEMNGVHCGDDSGLGSVWEANLRMPAMVQWTGRIQPNTSTMALVSSLDVTPSILSLVFNHTIENRQVFDDNTFDGHDVSKVWLGRDDEYDSDERVLFFWRDGFLLNLAPLGPPYGRFDVVAIKVGRIKAWYWTKSAHYNNDDEVYHYPPLLFDTILDPAEAFPIEYPFNDTSNKYTHLVHRIDHLMEEHKQDIASSLPYPLTLVRDAKYIPCVNRKTGCRSEPLFSEVEQVVQIHS